MISPLTEERGDFLHYYLDSWVLLRQKASPNKEYIGQIRDAESNGPQGIVNITVARMANKGRVWPKGLSNTNISPELYDIVFDIPALGMVNLEKQCVYLFIHPSRQYRKGFVFSGERVGSFVLSNSPYCRITNGLIRTGEIPYYSFNNKYYSIPEALSSFKKERTSTGLSRNFALSLSMKYEDIMLFYKDCCVGTLLPDGEVRFNSYISSRAPHIIEQFNREVITK